MSVYYFRKRKGEPRAGTKIAVLMKKFNSKCYYCEREVFFDKFPYATIEHVDAKTNGGADHEENLKLACCSCNFMKSSWYENEFMEELYSLAEAVMRKKERMEKREKEAYMHGAKMAAEYLKEIGKTDLKTMTGDEALTFAECMCKNYHIFFQNSIDEE